MNEQRQAQELLTCEQCGKGGLRGPAGLHMHNQRAHKRNWSTKKKGASDDAAGV